MLRAEVAQVHEIADDKVNALNNKTKKRLSDIVERLRNVEGRLDAIVAELKKLSEKPKIIERPKPNDRSKK